MKEQNLYRIIAILTLVVNVSFSQSIVVPAVQSYESSNGELRIHDHVFIEIAQKELLDDAHGMFRSFQKDLDMLTRVHSTLKTTTKSKAGGIMFSTQTPAKNKPEGNEGYVITITDRIDVRANSIRGLFYAKQTLLQIFKQSRGVIQKGVIKDSPKYETRAIMIDCGRRYYQIESIKKLIRQMAWYKLNTLHMHFTEWNGFRLKSDKYPGLASEEAYTKDQIRDIQEYASHYFVDLVPEIDLPAHATAITDYKPDLAFKCESMRKARWQGKEADSLGKAWAIDVTRPEVREWINGLLDEWMPVFKSKYFHVGGDEYQYDPDKEQCPELMEYAKSNGFEKPGDVFIDWLNEVNQRVRVNGKTTQIWNWWRFGKNTTSIQPDTNIVVNVWNSPRIMEILNDGYKVIITPEEELYVSPGLDDGSGYGVVDCKKIYEDWKTIEHKNVLGYKLCIWSDRAEEHTDKWFEGKSFEPKVVFAEKMWTGTKATTLPQFLKRVDKVGDSPIY